MTGFLSTSMNKEYWMGLSMPNSSKNFPMSGEARMLSAHVLNWSCRRAFDSNFTTPKGIFESSTCILITDLEGIVTPWPLL